MGKDQELLEAARGGNVTVVEKILGQRAKRSGPLARWVSALRLLPYYYFYFFIFKTIISPFYPRSIVKDAIISHPTKFIPAVDISNVS